MDLMAFVVFLDISFMWYVSDRFLSILTPRSQTLSDYVYNRGDFSGFEKCFLDSSILEYSHSYSDS